MLKTENLHATVEPRKPRGIGLEGKSGTMTIALALGVLPIAQAASAQDASQLTIEQAAIVYDQCLARAAQRASRTDAPDERIFDIAQAVCAGTRTALLVGHAADGERTAVLDALDADKRASFPELTRRVRERRRAYEAQTGTSGPNAEDR